MHSATKQLKRHREKDEVIRVKKAYMASHLDESASLVKRTAVLYEHGGIKYCPRISYLVSGMYSTCSLLRPCCTVS